MVLLLTYMQVGSLDNIYKFVLNQEVTTEMGRMTSALKAHSNVSQAVIPSDYTCS